MAKIYGIGGVLTGKNGANVFAVRYGENIVRKYQPVVTNPNTTNQVIARAKLKLMSQLSAVLGDVIAIPRMGAVTGRNIFTKQNYKNATYSDNEAAIDITGLQITKSAVGISSLIQTRNGATLQVGLGYADHDIDRMVYVALQKLADGSVIYHSSAVVNSDPTGEFNTTLTVPASAEMYVLAYGVRLNNDRARVVYGDLISPSAQDIAKIMVNRTLTEDDVTLTKTVGIHSVAGD